jgi:hypothetical protein
LAEIRKQPGFKRPQHRNKSRHRRLTAIKTNDSDVEYQENVRGLLVHQRAPKAAQEFLYAILQRTCSDCGGLSVSCHKRKWAHSFDHLISA